jgi:large subunit ribosomal protein L5
MGVSEAVADKKVMDHAVSDLTKIAGQKPVVTKSIKPSLASRFVKTRPLVAWSHFAVCKCLNSWIAL